MHLWLMVLSSFGSDLQCNTFAQVVAAEYMKTYSLNEHIKSIIEKCIELDVI